MRDKSISRLCGILFIITCTTFLLRQFLTGGLIDANNISNTFKLVADNAFRYRLAIFGLIGTALITVGTVLSIIVDLPAAIVLGSGLPIILFEYILGFYLIFRGMKEKNS